MTRALRIALLVLLAAPPAAHAADASIWSKTIGVGPSRSPAATSSTRPFDMVGVHWRGTGTVTFRTRSAAGRWSSWRPAAPEAEDAPDLGVERLRPGWRLGNPWWTGGSDRIEVRTHGEVREVKAWFVASASARVPLRRVSIASSPRIVPRTGWNADERILRGPPKYAPVLREAIVHHTAGNSSYRPQESAAIVLGIQLYHVKANGWKDIGYNFLVDRYGQIFEGRAGGIDRNVIGAHAEGFNTGSTGVALIGTYSTQSPTKAAEAALAALLAWRLDVGHVDAASSAVIPSGGNSRFITGTPVTLRAISGHRDTGFTACPGDRLYSRLAALIEVAATTGLPKLYEPVARGTIGKTVRFSARLSQPLAWVVTVTGPGGKIVARKAGTGDRLAWTWNSAGLKPGRYVWTMEAGSDVRPARGVIGGTQPTEPPKQAALLSAVQLAPATVSPNGDGFADLPTLSYALGQSAKVTATIIDAFGVPAAVLFSAQPQRAGAKSLQWPLDALADGRYRLSVAAWTNAGRSATVERAVTVSRALAWVRADPVSFSPDGDGVADTTTFSFTLGEPAQIAIEVRSRGQLVALVFAGPLEVGDHAFIWDGRLSTGVAPAGSYEVWVTAVTANGKVTQFAGFDVLQRPG